MLLQQLLLHMQGKKQIVKRNEDSSALIEQQWLLVLAGKSAEKLVQIIRNYEMDLLTSSIDANPGLLEKYLWGLLIAGDYLELGFLLTRAKDVKNRGLLIAVAEAGRNENLKDTWKAVKAYIGPLVDNQLKSRVKEGTVKAAVTMLSKYYLTYSAGQIAKAFECNEEEMRQWVSVGEDGFIELKRQERQRDCLMSKLKELAIVANKMSKFQ